MSNSMKERHNNFQEKNEKNFSKTLNYEMVRRHLFFIKVFFCLDIDSLGGKLIL